MKDITLLFCRLALNHSRDFSAAVSADLYDYAASLLNGNGCSEQASAATSVANDIRNANAAQTHFDALLSSALEANKVP